MKQILIVDDDKQLRWLMQRQVEKLRFTAEGAMHGADALEKLLTTRYLLILMDVAMPIMDGLTATRLIRLSERENNYPRTPIVGLTCGTDREICLDAGMDDHFRQPVSMDDMRTILLRWLSPQ